MILKKCLPDAKNDNSSLIWQVLNPKTKEYELELPKCVHICQNNLPFDDEFHNMTWREGYKGVGEKANFKCSGNFNINNIFNKSLKCYMKTCRRGTCFSRGVNLSRNYIQLWTDK